MRWKLLLMILLLSSCNSEHTTQEIIFNNRNWMIYKINDTTLLVSPGVDGNKHVKPFILKTNETDKTKLRDMGAS